MRMEGLWSLEEERVVIPRASPATFAGTVVPSEGSLTESFESFSLPLVSLGTSWCPPPTSVAKWTLGALCLVLLLL